MSNVHTTPVELVTERRQALMQVCADALDSELMRAVAAFPDAATAEDLRPPEVGLVMLRGRISGSGNPFNVGEITVTRAVVKLAEGTVGYGYQMGRSRARARAAAIIDALGQADRHRPTLDAVFVTPVRARVAGERAETARQTAATRVDFFTMARGEDQ